MITIIRHHHNQIELDDNAVRFFKRMGLEYRFCCPFDGEQLYATTGVTPTLILGGSQNVTELGQFRYLGDELRWIEACLAEDVPVLGLCLGAQLLAHALGGKVSAREPEECEFGFYRIEPTEGAGDFLRDPAYFMEAHYQEYELPAGAERLASSERFGEQAFRYGDKAYGLQFHPEVNQAIHTNWLADDWATRMVSTPGAQSKGEQELLAPQHLKPQADWFEGLLAKLYWQS